MIYNVATDVNEGQDVSERASTCSANILDSFTTANEQLEPF